MKTGIITTDTYLNHDTGQGHPERADRVTIVIDHLNSRIQKFSPDGDLLLYFGSCWPGGFHYSQWTVPMIIKKTMFPDASGYRESWFPDASGNIDSRFPDASFDQSEQQDCLPVFAEKPRESPILSMQNLLKRIFCIFGAGSLQT